ncbi:hypothetical protein AQ505_20410 [Pedobacter sp. PACM 27299]|uniref:hypothetical protein n=1 Tax=Pedobacter sp. PACM 27299 TaxID=1727164 RepID=UPI000706791C|nr:hypothetical protein [Pedobacter sp. PACM 27299]ALL07643.1 hypothetical protein AQ505_20410 [Pedobacter sp. PACM 27299]
MNQNIIKKYGVDFKNKNINNKIDKVPHTNIPDLTIFLYGWGSSELNEDLLPQINKVLNEPDKEFESQNEIVLIDVNKDDVYFYSDEIQQFHMPTIEFKQIVEGWRDFLLSPPLNGAKP